MTFRRLLPYVLALPMAAQSFTDGPAFGGSLVFSEGLNPLGNAARYEKAGQGFALGYEDGDAKPKGFRDASDDLDQGLRSGDSSLQLRGLQDLAERPLAVRRKAYGFSWMETGGVLFAYQREEAKGLFLRPDADAARTGTAIGANATQALLRRSLTDRVIFGAGSAQGPDGQAFGLRLRLERVVWGQDDPPSGLGSGSPNALLDRPVPSTALAYIVNVDAGYELPLARNLKLGITADHLLPHRYWGGVESKAQFRAGLELELGPQVALRVESDLNQAQRLPLPVDQRGAAASFRLDLGGTRLTVGAERRTAGGENWTTFGASLSFPASSVRLGFGFQFGDDQPQRGLSARFNG